MNRFGVRAPAALGQAMGVAVLLAGWLLLGALPALADGGPHVATANSGLSTLASDSCAGCHRAHSAQGEALITGPDTEAMCLNCHGAAGTGATTDVEDGDQYALGSTQVRGTTVAGALRSGGFVEARIDSTHITRISYPKLPGPQTWFSSLVPVLATAQPVTSAHLHVGSSSVQPKNVAWGNGNLNSGAGPSVSLECVGCHNPHGNGLYRILNPIPAPTGSGFVAVTAPGNSVTDAALPTGTGASATRNYTILWGRTLADVTGGTYPGGGTGPDGGDYWRRYLPWNGVPGWNGVSPTPASGIYRDRPMYVPNGTNLNSFPTQITLWCSACHTRYDQLTGAYTDTGDSVFRYRHDVNQVECTTCHVAHGSNALMTGAYASNFPYPDDNPAGTRDLSPSSRLLKVANRGTCQQCHDPTNTIPFTNVISSPSPTP